MIRHMVMWKFLDEANGNTKQANMNHLEMMLKDLADKIPTIRSMQVVRHMNPLQDGWDMALILDMDSFEALAEYSINPDHVAVSAFCKIIRKDRAVIDYSL